jgi:hypothetical protein
VAGSLNETAAWRLATGIAGQTALLTSLLLFFGWARTQATFAYFGVDLSLLNFSTTDYVLRSVNTAYTPLLLIGLGSLGGVLLHRRLGHSRWEAERVRTGVLAVGWVFVALGVSSLLWGDWARAVGSVVPDDPGIAFAWLPASLAIGFALLLYGTVAAPAGEGKRDANPQATFAFVALLVMALFWTVSLLAVHDGRARAQQIERDSNALPEVALLSKDVMLIQGPGVVATPIELRGSRYRHSYSGLRLLAHADGKYLLIPLTWRRGRDRVYSITDEPTVRIELIAH